MNTAERYLRFAREEAHGSSPIYEGLANFIAFDEPTLTFLDTLPAAQRQPNLLFGAVRLLAGTVLEASEFAKFVQSHAEPLAALMRNRKTQTNEPARTATLLPLLAQIPGPLALLEVGASAGLCLLPDHYAYQFNVEPVISPQPAQTKPTFKCAASKGTPIPRELPDVVWRRGLDLNPLDVTNADDMQWLQMLIWPEHTTRLLNFKQAVRVAANAKPIVDQGDLLSGLASSVAEAPSDATLVVFHSAVLAYVSTDVRQQFRKTVSEMDCVWISNEDARLFPDIAAKTKATLQPDQFLLSMDGEPIAQTGPHGQSINWLTD